jgi:hypothetical protein
LRAAWHRAERPHGVQLRFNARRSAGKQRARFAWTDSSTNTKTEDSNNTKTYTDSSTNTKESNNTIASNNTKTSTDNSLHNKDSNNTKTYTDSSTNTKESNNTIASNNTKTWTDSSVHTKDSNNTDNSVHTKTTTVSKQELDGEVSGISVSFTPGLESDPPGAGDTLTTGNIDSSGSAFSGVQTASLNTGIGSLNQAATSLAANANISFGP